MCKTETIGNAKQHEDIIVQALSLQGVRTHNLKNVNLVIPHNQITLVIGPSGSGKSSLVFDTIFHESQRQFVESLSSLPRQIVGELTRPSLDSVKGLQPTIGLEQKMNTPDPYSTVGDISGIYNILYALTSTIGSIQCERCNREIKPLSAAQIVKVIEGLPENTRFILLSPIQLKRVDDYGKLFERLRRQGVVRVRVNGTILDISRHNPEFTNMEVHSIEVVKDRLIRKEGISKRILDSVTSILRETDGILFCSYEKTRKSTATGGVTSVWKDLLFSSRNICPKCGANYPSVTSQNFNYNTTSGACSTCKGRGEIEAFNLDLYDKGGSFSELEAQLKKEISESSKRVISDFFSSFFKQFPATQAQSINSCPQELIDTFLYGSSSKKSLIDHPSTLDSSPAFDSLIQGQNLQNESINQSTGLLSVLESLFLKATNQQEKKYWASLRSPVECPECHGARISKVARHVSIQGKTFFDLTSMNISQLNEWFSSSFKLNEVEIDKLGSQLEHLFYRLNMMEKLQLSYLSLNRLASTLSSGELQRVRLSSILGNKLHRGCYILDEPTAGLHPQEIQNLCAILQKLKEDGNTIIIVGHNPELMNIAENVIELGPGSGVNGGEIIASGSPDLVQKIPTSLAHRWSTRNMEIVTHKRKIDPSDSIILENISTNNLRNVTVRFPLHALVCITGVSGSGKSSLISQSLIPMIKTTLTASSTSSSSPCLKRARIQGVEKIGQLIEASNLAIGRNPRSNPATYSGMFDDIRSLFAETKDAKILGFTTPGRFSFNIKGGRCKECLGLGIEKSESLLSSNSSIPCPVCNGKRFNNQTLQVRYQGKTIADVLEMTFDEAHEFFSNQQHLLRYINAFRKMGLGYLKLGQPSDSFSVGEAQRVKLATELIDFEKAQNALYVLDEPTSGLNSSDIDNLLVIFNELLDAGNSIIVIEHSLDVIKNADWIIDLGPEGGDKGGRILASASPKELSQSRESITGKYLRALLN